MSDDPLGELGPGAHVAIYVSAPFVRIAVEGTSLVLEVSNPSPHSWVPLGRVELGEATPIVSHALRELLKSLARGGR